ncbi:MAG: helix-turn-helix transcriptional regulator, partial [Bryobacteraceae bacterium]
LFRLEDRGLIAGRWLEKAGERRRRCYRLTPAGRKFLKAQRGAWDEFVATINQIVRPSHA